MKVNLMFYQSNLFFLNVSSYLDSLGNITKQSCIFSLRFRLPYQRFMTKQTGTKSMFTFFHIL